MRIYQRFGMVLAALVCIALMVMCAVLAVRHGVSTVDADTGVVTYFFQTEDFQTYLFVSLSFLVSAIATAYVSDLPYVTAGVALLPFGMTFYQMANANLQFIVAAITLLLALVHLSCNALACWDDWGERSRRKALAAAAAAQDADEAATAQAQTQAK